MFNLIRNCHTFVTDVIFFTCHNESIDIAFEKSVKWSVDQDN